MKKKLVQINVVCNGSTGKIMNAIQKKAIEDGWEAYSFFGRGKPANENCFKIGNNFDILWHVFITRLFNKHGHGSKGATKRLIKQIKKIDPDVIQLHNIHGYYLNFELLLRFLKEYKKPVIWTLHDCWSMTGHCASFVSQACNKWKELCEDCKYKNVYPKAYFGKKIIKKEYELKKELIKDIKDLTLIVPSNWMKQQVLNSYLKEKETYVINNYIDLDIFKYQIDKNIKEKYMIPEDRKIILGVSSVWNEEKGIKSFSELSKIIDSNDVIVMIGLKKKQFKCLPNNIIKIKRTDNQEELAKIYSIADVLFNPSISETFSLVTLEAIACHTPCVVVDSTATPELINDKIGIAIDKSDLKDINKIYLQLKNAMNIDKNQSEFIEKSSKYGIENYNKYMSLYEEILN